MHPTEILSAEHRVIEQVLDCLERMAEHARQEGHLEVERTGIALEFLGTFVDTCHHGKEEERLFPMLEARGLPRHAGPLAVMLDDHEAGREYLRQLSQARDAGDVEGFARAASGYVRRMREHIGKEDGVLFPMAESMLDSAARRTLHEAFHHFEPAGHPPGTRARLLSAADALARHYGVALAAERSPAAPPPGCGHGCP